LYRVERTVRRRMRLGQLNQDALVQYLRRGQVAELVAALGYLTGVDQKTARRIVFTPGHEAVAVACRAKGFDLSTFSTIVLLLDGDDKNQAETGVEKKCAGRRKLPICWNYTSRCPSRRPSAPCAFGPYTSNP